MKKLLCFLNLHKWEYSGPEFETQMALDLDIPDQPAKRSCSRCDKKQTLSTLSVNLYSGATVKAWSNTK